MARRTRQRMALSAAAAATAAALALAACGRSAPGTGNNGGGNNGGQVSPTKGLVVSTTPGTKPVSSVTWAVYRDVNSLDPIFAFDYPENTADSLMCESLLKQAPDGSIGPGLATLTNPSPTKFVFTIQQGAKFWDGHPVTPADVVYSLDRAMSPKLGGFYTLVFSRVKSIAATGSSQVTITLKQPDYWLARRARLDAGNRHREGVRAEAGQEVRDPVGQHHVHRRVQVQVVRARRRRHRGAEHALLAALGQAAGRPDHHQGRRLGHRADLGPEHRRDPGHLHLGWPVHAAAAQGRQRGEHLQRPGLVDRCVHHRQPEGRARRCPGAAKRCRWR